MSIGKYLTNFGVLGALMGVLSVSKQTRNMPNDWRRYLVWGSWMLGLVLAIAGVAKAQEDEQYQAEIDR
ncbi:hypothetical protein [Leucobacter sp. M11]|uniref:hypothetical protein n=1 Tax=Leucobacter sp. M11 TaxID=2993565 RepID=UPI002D806A56|nr:hypothetical protein [Leucobacter sp. M11]MEB4615853.1 hypothetical protein [Leucobacter sp. M11]